MIGSQIDDRFQVNERLVQRGPIELYEGVDLIEGRLVWIKRLVAPLDQDLDFVENWEAQLLSVQALESPTIPHIHTWGRLPENDLYQVEDIPQGSTLRRWSAARAPMAVADSVSLILAAAQAVGLAHREGVAHGGLSPETIFVGQRSALSSEIEISSWESGEVISALNNAGGPTPERLARYLAPEQTLAPAPPPTPAIDVYALGLMLYELLTGTLPTAAGVAGAVEPTSPRRFNPEIPVALERELLRALSPDPVARHPQGLSLAQALIQAMQEPAALAPAEIEPADTLVVERTPAWWPAAALLSLLALCSLLFLLWYTNRDQPAIAAALTPTPVPVPNLVGPPYVPFNDASIIAWNQGYVVSIIGFVEGENIPDGVVVTQCPAPGSPPGQVNVQCGESVGVAPSENTIWVEVSSLPEPSVLRVVPDLYGQPEPEARAILEAGGLRLGSVRTAFDTRMPEGRIVEQNPRRGVAVLGGEAVDIIVSAGPPAAVAGEPPPAVQPTATTAPPPPEEVPTEPIVEELPTAAPSPTLEPQPPPVEPTETLPGAVLFEDDFENGNVNGWSSIETGGDGESAVIANGVLAVNLTTPGLFWSSRPEQLFTDFTYEADIAFDATTAAEPEASAGIIFRVQDESSFYFFEINARGEHRLRVRRGDEWVVDRDWTTEAALQGAGDVNRLSVTAFGDRLILVANGSQLAVTDLPADLLYMSGDIGLAAQAGNEPLVVQFDNVVVSR